MTVFGGGQFVEVTVRHLVELNVVEPFDAALDSGADGLGHYYGGDLEFSAQSLFEQMEALGDAEALFGQRAFLHGFANGFEQRVAQANGQGAVSSGDRHRRIPTLALR